MTDTDIEKFKKTLDEIGIPYEMENYHEEEYLTIRATVTDDRPDNLEFHFSNGRFGGKIL